MDTNSKSASHSSPTPFWQELGQSILHSGSWGGVEISDWALEWVQNLLSPLDLPEAFLNKVTASMLEAAARTPQGESGEEREFTHLAVLVQRDRPKTGGTWGYFWLAKVDERVGDLRKASHTIELYLFVDPKVG